MDINKPAKFLEGKELKDGWRVKEKIVKVDDSKIIKFSQTYLVEKTGKIAILKALDFSVALLDDDPTKALIQLSKSYDFEKELHLLCEEERLNRIVKIISQGKIPPLRGSIIPVPYLILEFAEQDIRSQIDFDTRLNTAWLLRILHNVSVGLWQLHKHGVAHTNIRSENILEINKKLQKISELGGSDKRGYENPSKEFLPSTDPTYLTPEFLYGKNETEWIYKSQAADIYQLGSLVFFLFTQSDFNTWLFIGLDRLNPNYRPGKWGGTFEEVLPYLEDAYDWAISNFFSSYLDLDIEIKTILELNVRQLCHPNPKKRGHPKSIASNDSSMSVERFINEFKRMAIKAENKLTDKTRR